MVLFAVVLAILAPLGRSNYLLFHALAEFFSVVVACSIFVVAWNSRRFQNNGFWLLLGCISLSAAVLDLFHTMAYKGMGVFPGGGAPLATQFWIAARYLQAGAFLLAPLYVRRTLAPRLTFVGCVALALALVAVILSGGIFPDCYIEGEGITPFKKFSEYLFIAMYLGALALLQRRREAFDPAVLRLLRMSIVTFVLSGLAFSAYADVFGYTNQAGHLLKVLGCYFLYRGVIAIGLTNPYNLLFRELKLKEEALVSERNELRESRERTDRVLESMYESFFSVDREWRLTYVNSQASRLLTRSREELLGKVMWEEFPEAVGSVFYNEYHEALALQQVRVFEEYYSPLDAWFEVHAYPSPDGLSVFFNDVTERKRIHEEIELLNTDLAARAAELEVLNGDLEAFNSSVSHDLRGPITNICGQCQVILELFPHKADAEVLDFVRGILDESWRMNDLINTLLDFSRLGRVEMKREPVDLSSLAQEIAAAQAARFPERSVRFAADEGLTTTGDPGLLRIVLENLLGNAWKYTGKTADAAVRFGVLETEGRRAFYVRDNGAGFDMTRAGNLFAPFKRLHASSEFEGFGIGLATVHRIVTRHGGRIWAEGEPGRGATFYFTL
ncbi:hypothetical protein GPICK_09190 [Geobacter pickeringii]|uniref:histidine kinase n=1 Tax=Geobacter pickeringii TaxID=345632 RepID=A0A0B5BEK9_9BACT|nr:hypothetical protein GPICK_09190 [Geobacter pickeringii]